MHPSDVFEGHRETHGQHLWRRQTEKHARSCAGLYGWQAQAAILFNTHTPVPECPFHQKKSFYHEMNYLTHSKHQSRK